MPEATSPNSMPKQDPSSGSQVSRERLLEIIASIGKVMAVLGLLLSLAGLALLVAVAVTTTQNVLDAVHASGVETPYTQYLTSGWPVAVGLLAGGFAVNRFARIIVGR